MLSDLVEHLRLLGFPRLVSLENFSSPNFQLVSEILTWAMMTVDSDYDLPTNIDSEQDRVIVVRVAAIFFVGIGLDKMFYVLCLNLCINSRRNDGGHTREHKWKLNLTRKILKLLIVLGFKCPFKETKKLSLPFPEKNSVHSGLWHHIENTAESPHCDRSNSAVYSESVSSLGASHLQEVMIGKITITLTLLCQGWGIGLDSFKSYEREKDSASDADCDSEDMIDCLANTEWQIFCQC